MSFPWGILIASSSTLLAGGVGATVGGVMALRADSSHAARKAASAKERQHLDACIDLTTTARMVLRAFRQVKIGFVETRGIDPEINPVISQVASLGNELNRAVALVEMVGLADARSHARLIYTATRVAADMFQDREIALLHAGGRWRNLPPFDSDTADKALAELETAVESFIDVVRLARALRNRRLLTRWFDLLCGGCVLGGGVGVKVCQGADPGGYRPGNGG